MTAIVVPIFNALAASRRCLRALAETVGERRPVIVINDASTEAGIETLFEELPGSWVRVHNQRNLGFVATANFGLSLASGEDVILLNSDTQVTTGWLEAIEACAASDPSIASITPLSNNAEIASIPDFCQANPWPEHPDDWARACRDSGSPQYPRVPTAVGFCMFMRRRCMDQIGAFDELAFGKGYGEENDWCMRAIAAGWHHVLCDHAYVAHEGNASFGLIGLGPGGEAMTRLLNRHPDYLDQIQTFIQSDPMAQRRKTILNKYQTLNP